MEDADFKNILARLEDRLEQIAARIAVENQPVREQLSAMEVSINGQIADLREEVVALSVHYNVGSNER